MKYIDWRIDDLTRSHRSSVGMHTEATDSESILIGSLRDDGDRRHERNLNRWKTCT